MKRFLILILFLTSLFTGNAQSETAQLICKNESRSWPQSGKIYKGKKVMFFKIDFRKDGTVEIYQGKNEEPFKGSHAKNVIKSVVTTKNSFERDLVINLNTGSFTDRYFVIHHGKQEAAWIDKGNCEF
ncbi:MAG: hypothetical protein KJO81_04370 [Gammaproteobacteria bacterium]|nr:hypothetical protein [Gammaproteobacteria bacterium]